MTKEKLNDVEILMSVMYEKDNSKYFQAGLTGDCIIVNQCDSSNMATSYYGKNRVVRIDSMSRGLSKSRNIALHVSKADICMITDDDINFVSNYEELILAAYDKLPDASVIVFGNCAHPDKFNGKFRKLNRFDILKVASVEISFKRKDIIENQIFFDERIGAGSNFGGSGEENKFLLDCLTKNLNIYYMPIFIVSMRDSESTWFNGFDAEYFYKRGNITRYVYGLRFSIIYAVYFLLRKYPEYRNDITFRGAFENLFRGIIDNKLKS